MDLLTKISKLDLLTKISKLDLLTKISKLDLLTKILLLLIVLFIILMIINYKNKNFLQESYNNKLTFEDFDNYTLFDEFYSKMYDKLHNDDNKNNIIINIIKNKCNIKNTSNILDIGCGTGEIVSKLSDFNVIGLDKSSSMIKLCNSKFPKNKFIVGDILNNYRLNYNYDFTHVLCLNFTIYYIDNRRLFFKNIYEILTPNGILVLHLVEKNKFNRTINACKINNFNPAKYLKNKKIKSNISFDNFEYNCEYDIQDNKCIINETFNFANKSVRKNIHNLNMDSNKIILNEAKKYGFIIDGQIKITNNDGEYLYILKKNI